MLFDYTRVSCAFVSSDGQKIAILEAKLSAVEKEVRQSKQRAQQAERRDKRNVPNKTERTPSSSQGDAETSTNSTSDLHAGLSDERPNMSEDASDPCGAANYDSGSSFESRVVELRGPGASGASLLSLAVHSSGSDSAEGKRDASPRTAGS